VVKGAASGASAQGDLVPLRRSRDVPLLSRFPCPGRVEVAATDGRGFNSYLAH